MLRIMDMVLAGSPRFWPVGMRYVLTKAESLEDVLEEGRPLFY